MNESRLSKSVSWKSRKSSMKQADRFNLSYKREMKQADSLHTHTHRDYCNPRAHAQSINEAQSTEIELADL